MFTVLCHIISNLATICGCEDPDTDSLILFQFISRHYLSWFLFSSLLELYVALFLPIISYHLNESKLLHATDKTLNKCWVEVSVSPCMSFPLFDFYPFSFMCFTLLFMVSHQINENDHVNSGDKHKDCKDEIGCESEKDNLPY